MGDFIDDLKKLFDTNFPEKKLYKIKKFKSGIPKYIILYDTYFECLRHVSHLHLRYNQSLIEEWFSNKHLEKLSRSDRGYIANYNLILKYFIKLKDEDHKNIVQKVYDEILNDEILVEFKQK